MKVNVFSGEERCALFHYRNDIVFNFSYHLNTKNSTRSFKQQHFSEALFLQWALKN